MGQKKQEPLSAILAEMRADADNGRCYRRYRIERLADRIEAAVLAWLYDTKKRGTK